VASDHAGGGFDWIRLAGSLQRRDWLAQVYPPDEPGVGRGDQFDAVVTGLVDILRRSQAGATLG